MVNQGGFCAKCGAAVSSTDRFCAKCGYELQVELPSTTVFSQTITETSSKPAVSPQRKLSTFAEDFASTNPFACCAAGTGVVTLMLHFSYLSMGENFTDSNWYAVAFWLMIFAGPAGLVAFFGGLMVVPASIIGLFRLAFGREVETSVRPWEEFGMYMLTLIFYAFYAFALFRVFSVGPFPASDFSWGG
jgi:hypothetical protein